MIPQCTLRCLAGDIHNSPCHPLCNHLSSNYLGGGKREKKKKRNGRILKREIIISLHRNLAGYYGRPKNKTIWRKQVLQYRLLFIRVKARGREGVVHVGCWVDFGLQSFQPPQWTHIPAMYNLVTAFHGGGCSDYSSSPGKHEAQPQNSHQETYK